VKLLLDVHHSPRAVERLRERGHDVVAAATDHALSSMADEDLLRHASAEGRAIVTENAKDFGGILRTWATTGEQHAGVIFTSSRRFHRGSAAYPENVVVALARLLDAPPDADKDWVHWLE
jgi:predicted nuclease of predicted toxin-antitoxin system